MRREELFSDDLFCNNHQIKTPNMEFKNWVYFISKNIKLIEKYKRNYTFSLFEQN